MKEENRSQFPIFLSKTATRCSLWLFPLTLLSDVAATQRFLPSLKQLKCKAVFQRLDASFTMLPKYIWGIFWASVALASNVPGPCLVTSVQILCSTFYIRTLDKCISNSLPTDIFIKEEENQVCYVVHPDRCIPSDFCPQAKVKRSSIFGKVLLMLCCCNLTSHISIG